MTKQKQNELPHRYWVSLGNWETIFVNPTDEEENMVNQKHKLICNEIKKLANRVGPNSPKQYSFITTDLTEAQRIASKGHDIIVKHLDLNGEDAGIIIMTQPICPDCHHLGRFYSLYCVICGTPYILPQKVEYIWIPPNHP